MGACGFVASVRRRRPRLDARDVGEHDLPAAVWRVGYRRGDRDDADEEEVRKHGIPSISCLR